MQTVPTAARWLIASTLAALAGSAAGQADIYRLNIPDFDQRRAFENGNTGLPNRGRMYCAPTSAIDFMAYIANHGQPQMMSGPRDWQSQSNYEFVTDSIRDMGDLMGTDPIDGTTVGALPGVIAWIAVRAPGLFTVSFQQSLLTLGVEPYQMYSVMDDGGLVMLNIGWYKYDSGKAAWYRDGGHVCALQFVYDADGDMPRIGYHDPGDETTDEGAQSTFSTRESDMVEFAHDAIYELDDSQIYNRTRWELLRYRSGEDDENIGMFDGFMLIQPIWSLTSDAVNGKIQVEQPPVLVDDGEPEPEPQEPPDGHLFTRAEILALNFTWVVTTDDGNNGGTLYVYDAAADELRKVLELLRSGPMATGIDGHLFIETGGSLRKIWLDPRDPEASQTVAQINVAGAGLDELVYDDANDRLVGVSSALRSLLIFDPDLAGVSTAPLPAGVNPADPVAMDIGPDGSVWLGGDGNDTVVRIAEDQGRWVVAEVIDLGGGRGIDSIQVDARGHLYASVEGVVNEWFLNPASRRWEPVANSAFAGLQTGGIFRIAKSRSNFRPGWAASRAFRNIEPDTAEPGASDPGDRAYCEADLTTTPDPQLRGYGFPDGVVNDADLDYFRARFALGDLLRCDRSGRTPGVPDGRLDQDDVDFYTLQWQRGLIDCPEPQPDFGRLFAVDRTTTDLVTIDAATGQVGAIGPIATPGTSISSLEAVGQRLFAVERDPAGGGWLLELDPADGTTITRRRITLGGAFLNRPIEGLGHSLDDGQLRVAYTGAGASNGSISNAVGVLGLDADITGVRTFGPLDDHDGLCQGGTDGSLLWIDRDPIAGSVLMGRISTAGARSFVAVQPFTSVFNGVNDLAPAYERGIVYAVDSVTGLVHEMDPGNLGVLRWTAHTPSRVLDFPAYRPTCAADLTADGVLNEADVLLAMRLVDLGEPTALFPTSEPPTMFTLLEYLRAFDAGCDAAP